MLCGNKTDQCPKCHRYIRRGIFAYHYENNCADLDDDIDTPTPRLKNSSVNHPRSNSTRSDGQMMNIKNYDQEDDSGYYNSIYRTKISDKQNSLDTVKCIFCNHDFAFIEYKIHQENCVENPDNTNKKQQQKSFKSNETRIAHSSEVEPGTSNNIIHIPCEICNEQIDIYSWSTHTQDCREREIHRIEARAQVINREPISEKLPCEYCQKLYSVKRLGKHQISCEKNPDNLEPVSTVTLLNTTPLSTYSSLQPSRVSSDNVSLPLTNDMMNRINNRRHSSVSQDVPLTSNTILDARRNEETMKLRENNKSSLPIAARPPSDERRTSFDKDSQLINSDTNQRKEHHLSRAQSLSRTVRSGSVERHLTDNKSLPQRTGSSSTHSLRPPSVSNNSRNSRGSFGSSATNATKPLVVKKPITFHSDFDQDQEHQPKLNQRSRPTTKTTRPKTQLPSSDRNQNTKTTNENSTTIRIGASILLGIIFGFLMNKANVYLAPTIREQMLFKRFAMIKMFLAAVGMSMLSVVLLILINESIYRKVLNGFIQRNNRINALQLIIGGSLIGVGMVLAGSCPGTIFVQIGSGLRNSFITGIGASCGVLFYYLFLNDRITKCELPKSSTVLQQLPDLMGIKRIYINLIFGLLFIGISFLLESLIPYKNNSIEPNDSLVRSGWSPVLCGVGIGLLQLFFMMFFEKSLGISTGFTVIVAQLCRINPVKKLIPSLEPFAYGIQNNLTLLFSFGAILGSFVATVLIGQFPLNEKYGANAFDSFLGGFLLLIGARCAGGCTSGQGISGFTHLLIGSLIATAAMFGGGILFAISYGLITGDWQFYGL
ncbi:unnamed protein product [Adineta steineri]|uniref:Sulphur transport domain-containing protein n=1 Tax=Adineta steineri TaxID=433720 RepID=A0A819K500_9BILA|nr:unnamed protein product [Adineta steineri]